MNLRSLSLAFGLLAFGTLACSGSQESADESSNDELLGGDTSIPANATSVEGKFTVDVDRYAPRYAFTLSKIDWRRRTAKWDSTVVDRDGYAAASNDRGLDATIDVMRCPACFTLHVFDQGAELATLNVVDGKVRRLVYSRKDARDVKITKVQAAMSAATDDVDTATSTRGSCKQICSGAVKDCKESVERDQCNQDLFPNRYRCPTTFDFAPGGGCD